MDPSRHPAQQISVRRLTVSLLLAGLISGAVVGFAYVSLLLVAPLEGLGIPATGCLAAAFLIKTEQATVFLVSRWRPALFLLVLSAVPATPVAFGLRGLFHWHGWVGIVLAVGSGLVVQAVVLHCLAATLLRRGSESPADLAVLQHDRGALTRTGDASDPHP